MSNQAMSPRTLVALARSAARELSRPDEPLTWSAALDAAPWPKGAPPALEREFRKAFAEGLLKRGIAKKPGGQGKATSSGVTLLAGRRVYATPEEFAEQDQRWREGGFRSWSDWARRTLATAR